MTSGWSTQHLHRRLHGCWICRVWIFPDLFSRPSHHPSSERGRSHCAQVPIAVTRGECLLPFNFKRRSKLFKMKFNDRLWYKHSSECLGTRPSNWVACCSISNWKLEFTGRQMNGPQVHFSATKNFSSVLKYRHNAHTQVQSQDKGHFPLLLFVGKLEQIEYL